MRLDVANELSRIGGDFVLMNKSELARRFNCDRRTVDKYLKEKTTTRKVRKVRSVLNNYENTVKNKIDLGSTAMAVYKFIEKQGYSGSYQTVYNFAKKHKGNLIKKATIRFETNPGLQAQVDWKEKLTMINKFGEEFEINIFLMILGYSRKKFLKLTSNRTQKTLFECMTEAFKFMGGIPKEILFDNMTTVVDRKNANFKKISINKVFDHFSKDAGFDIVTCRPYRAQTKGKVEALAKLTNRLVPYNGEFETFKELEAIVNELNLDLNEEVSQATLETPNNRFKKEKEYLSPMPSLDTLTSYFFQEKSYKVSKESMINYKGKKYSVPIRYLSKYVNVNETTSDICIYYTGDLIVCHKKSNRILNYKETHVKEILISDALSHYDDKEINAFIENNLKKMDIFLEMEDY